MFLNQNQNNQNLISQVNKFASELKNSGKNPEQILNELISSGKYSQSQIEQAKTMAQMAMSLFNK